MEAAVRNGGARSSAISLRRVLWVAPLAGVVAALVNGVLYAITAGVGLIPVGFEAPNGAAIGLGAVATTSFVPALVAGGLLTLLARFTRRPVRNFRVVAVVALVVSLVTPFSLPVAPVALVVVLLLMLVVAAVAITGLLTTLARR